MSAHLPSPHDETRRALPGTARFHRAPVPEPVEDPLPDEHPVPQEEPVPSPNPEIPAAASATPRWRC